MKKAVIYILSIALLCLCGGFIIHQHNQTQRNYYSAIENGQVQISNHKYSIAEEAFQDASKAGENSHKGKTLLRQTQLYVRAKQEFEKHQFNRAYADYQRVANIIGGSDLLYQYSNHKLKEIDTIKDNLNKFMTIYNQAADDSHNNKIKKSNSILEQLLNDSTIKEPYYNGIRKHANHLKQFNNQMSNVKTSSKNNDIYSFDNKALNKDSNKPTTNQKSKNNTKNSNKNKDNYINKDQVLEARKLIQKAGVESGSLSDQDVRVIIRQALQHKQAINRYVKAHPKSIQ